MSELKRISGIDINEDMEYQWREWRVHRVAWGVFALILLASLVGLFGQGPLSHASVGDPGSALVLSFERIDRYRAPSELEVMLGSNVAQEGVVRLSLNHEFLERVQIDRILPEPESVETGPDAVTYTFRITAPDRPSQVRFDYEYDQYGPAQGELRLEGGPALEFRSFVFP